METDVLGIPLWAFLLCGVGSLFVGLAIRWWLDRRREREEREIKEKAAEMRLQQKRYKKMARKAEKAEKQKKSVRRDS